MAKKCGKCDPHEICEECPEWIFTLADLIMCMMGLFVILWVLKPSPKPQRPEPDEEWIKVAAAIREAFGYMPDPQSKDPIDVHMLMKKIEEMDPMKGKGDGGETKRERRSPTATDPESSTIRPGKVSTTGGRMTFDPGKSGITPEMIIALDQVVDLVRGHRNIVMVKGHGAFDDFPDGAATPEQRMDLSLRRAQAAADYLISKGVEPDTLRVQGCSTFEPISRGNPDPKEQEKNRRVEIETTASLVSDRADTPKAAKALETPAPPSAEAVAPDGAAIPR